MDIRRMTIRIPSDLFEQLSAAAQKEQRSVHGQILWMLQRGLDEAQDV